MFDLHNVVNKWVRNEFVMQNLHFSLWRIRVMELLNEDKLINFLKNLRFLFNVRKIFQLHTIRNERDN